MVHVAWLAVAPTALFLVIGHCPVKHRVRFGLVRPASEKVSAKMGAIYDQDTPNERFSCTASLCGDDLGGSSNKLFDLPLKLRVGTVEVLAEEDDAHQ